MTPKILLSFDVEEFDMPLEYGFNIHTDQQMEVGKKGLDALSPLLNDSRFPSTLFTTANFASQFPEDIHTLGKQHEIASHTYFHSSFEKDDLLSSRMQLELIAGKNITGLRMPRMKIIDAAWIRQAGYAYDASIHPIWLPGRYNNLNLSRKPYLDKGLLRIPASTTPVLRLPLFWLSFKNFPFAAYREFCRRTLHHDGHLSLYFHPWEFTDIRGFGLPAYTRKHCGERLLERLHLLMENLVKEGECITMGKFATS